MADKPLDKMNDRELLIALVQGVRSVNVAMLTQSQAINAQAAAINNLAEAIFQSFQEDDEETGGQGLNNDKPGRIVHKANK